MKTSEQHFVLIWTWMEQLILFKIIQNNLINFLKTQKAVLQSVLKMFNM